MNLIHEFLNQESKKMLRFSRRFFSQGIGSDAHFFAQKLDKHGIVVFNMNRPKQRNAISQQFVREFAEAIKEHQDSATAIILTSSTPGMFCAGADLKERKDMSQE